MSTFLKNLYNVYMVTFFLLLGLTIAGIPDIFEISRVWFLLTIPFGIAIIIQPTNLIKL